MRRPEARGGYELRGKWFRFVRKARRNNISRQNKFIEPADGRDQRRIRLAFADPICNQAGRLASRDASKCEILAYHVECKFPVMQGTRAGARAGASHWKIILNGARAGAHCRSRESRQSWPDSVVNALRSEDLRKGLLRRSNQHGGPFGPW